MPSFFPWLKSACPVHARGERGAAGRDWGIQARRLCAFGSGYIPVCAVEGAAWVSEISAPVCIRVHFGTRPCHDLT